MDCVEGEGTVQEPAAAMTKVEVVIEVKTEVSGDDEPEVTRIVECGMIGSTGMYRVINMMKATVVIEVKTEVSGDGESEVTRIVECGMIGSTGM